MGVTTKPIVFVGKSFLNEAKALEFFQSKITMTAKDLDEMGPHLEYWLEPRIRQRFPQCGVFNHFVSQEHCGFYIGYLIYDEDPQRMVQKITQASERWNTMFGEKPKVLQDVIYS